MSEKSNEEASSGGDMPNDTKGNEAETENREKLEKPKNKRKVIRVLTVMAYVLSVSLAAIMLSLYYVFLWDPKLPGGPRSSARTAELSNSTHFNTTVDGGSQPVAQAHHHQSMTGASPTVETPIDGTPRN